MYLTLRTVYRALLANVYKEIAWGFIIGRPLGAVGEITLHSGSYSTVHALWL